MMQSTKKAVLAIVKADPSITREQANAALDALEGRTAAGLAVDAPTDRALTRRQVSEILGVKPATVTMYVRNGEIKAFHFGGKGKRAAGYSAESVRALLERGSGKAVA
jgi:hypothetical protein